MSRFAKQMLSFRTVPVICLALDLCACLAVTGCGCAGEKAPSVTTANGSRRRHLDAILELGRVHEGVIPLEALEEFSHDLDADEVAEALEYIGAHPDHTSYHVMMVLRRQSRHLYNDITVGIRAQVLSATLGRLGFTCDWSLLHSEHGQDYESGQALLETGRVAIRYLRPHLNNWRGCPFMGRNDKSSTLVSFNTHQRVCDYAYYYIVKLLGETPKFNPEFAERNVAIKALKERLLQLDAIN